MGLFEPVWMTDKSKKLMKALAAVEGMSDPSELKDVAMRAPLPNVAKAACQRVVDEADLVDIAIGAKSTGASLEAVYHRIHSQEAFAKVARETSNRDVRSRALDKIEDPTDIVLELIRGGDVRSFYYANRVNDKASLREVVFDLFDQEAVARDERLLMGEKELVFEAIAGAVEKFEDDADIERAATLFGGGCPAGSYTQPIRMACETAKRKNRAVEKYRRRMKRWSKSLKQGDSERRRLMCRVCGMEVSLHGTLREDAYFNCRCGVPDQDNWEIEMAEGPHSRSLIIVELCPSCMGLKKRSDSSVKHYMCDCAKGQVGKLGYVPVVFKPDNW